MTSLHDVRQADIRNFAPGTLRKAVKRAVVAPHIGRDMQQHLLFSLQRKFHTLTHAPSASSLCSEW